MRREVREYSKEMEEAMAKKDNLFIGKLNYKNIDIKYLAQRASDKFQDLMLAVYSDDTKAIIKKSISTSNYCMILREKVKERKNGDK